MGATFSFDKITCFYSCQAPCPTYGCYSGHTIQEEIAEEEKKGDVVIKMNHESAA